MVYKWYTLSMKKINISLDLETLSILKEIKDTHKLSMASIIRMAIRALYKQLCP
ncbi:MAG: ribbon-helix-helix protein, CopG family [Caulobacteraceae bacterium]|nr:ribbon-helix-helix protein, CopG family [Caulobacteraceae bacterium]